MKKYKSILDIVLLASLFVMSFLAIAPKTFVMPTSVQMLFLAVVLVLIATFLLLLWREQPSDEREAHNQAAASRLAYIVGSVVLIITMVVQSLHHRLDAAIPIILLAMIATKLIIQRTKDDS
jgi:hypothetical protein